MKIHYIKNNRKTECGLKIRKGIKTTELHSNCGTCINLLRNKIKKSFNEVK